MPIIGFILAGIASLTFSLFRFETVPNLDYAGKGKACCEGVEKMKITVIGGGSTYIALLVLAGLIVVGGALLRQFLVRTEVGDSQADIAWTLPVIGAALAGFAGCLFANWGAFVSPTIFGLAQSAHPDRDVLDSLVL